MTSNATHHVTPIDLGAVGQPDASSPEAALERAIAVTVLGTTGVHALGTPVARAVGALRSRLGAGGVTGVTITRTTGGVVVDVALVAEYPTNVTELAETVRTQVGHAVAQLDADGVTVDVMVTDVHGPFDEADELKKAQEKEEKERAKEEKRREKEEKRAAAEREAAERDAAERAAAATADSDSASASGSGDDGQDLGDRARGLADSAANAIADAIDGTADAVDGAVDRARDARDRADDDRPAVAHDDAADAERIEDARPAAAQVDGPVDERDDAAEVAAHAAHAADAAASAAEAAARAAEAAAEAADAARDPEPEHEGDRPVEATGPVDPTRAS